MSLTVTFEQHVLNKVFRNINFTSPAALYVALYTTAPTDSGGGQEVNTGGYARQAVTFGAPTGGSPSQIANDAQVQFPEATADWSTIVAAGLFTASTGGNLVCWGNLTTPKTINTGDQAVFNVGSIVITCN